jgi:cobyric acid synthase
MSFRGKSRRFAEGSVSKDGLALGCSIYGLFDAPNFRNRIIDFLSRRKGINASTRELDAIEFWDEQIQKFSDTVKDSIDMHGIRKLVGLN